MSYLSGAFPVVERHHMNTETKEYGILIPSSILKCKGLKDSLKLTIGYLKFRSNLEGFTTSASDIALNIGCSIHTGMRNVEVMVKHGVLIVAGTKQSKTLKHGKLKEYTIYKIDRDTLNGFIKTPNLDTMPQKPSSTAKLAVEEVNGVSTAKLAVTLNKNNSTCTLNTGIVGAKLAVEESFKDFFVPNTIYQDLGKECPKRERRVVPKASTTPVGISDDPMFRNQVIFDRMMND